ncbi:MAG: hypothetical protein ACE5FA_11675 [Dehalococcoidia bacterium]
MAARAPRQGILEIVSMDGSSFLRMLRLHGRSEEAGPVSSQFEKELRGESPDFGVLALRACGHTVGALSYGCLDLPFEPGTVSGRIDVVVTERHCRGLGIGGILMASLFKKLIDEHGDRLRHFSTIAVHPAIVRFVSHFGFRRIEGGETPLYSITLNEATRQEFALQSERALALAMNRLRQRCLECRRRRWIVPWCTPVETDGSDK